MACRVVVFLRMHGLGMLCLLHALDIVHQPGNLYLCRAYLFNDHIMCYPADKGSVMQVKTIKLIVS